LTRLDETSCVTLRQRLLDLPERPPSEIWASCHPDGREAAGNHDLRLESVILDLV